MAQSDQPTPKPLRLWPGVAALILQLFLLFVLPKIFPETGIYGFFGALGLGLIIIIWWLFFSRAPRPDRWFVIPVMIVAAYAARFLMHKSIQGGMMGMMFGIYSIPTLSLALVVWAVISRNMTAGSRRLAFVVTLFAALGFWGMLRTEGMMGEGSSELKWRWTKTPEEKLLAEAKENEPLPPPSTSTETPQATPTQPEPVPQTAPTTSPQPVQPEVPPSVTPVEVRDEKPAEWPGFRGPNRDSIIHNVRINTDWKASPPVEIWRRPVGPAWSSFAVNGNLIYTQEQRGEEELVSCYNIKNGKPVWRHRDTARFWESNAGPGPRGTPTYSNGRIYTFGATGIVNSLDAANGKVIWSRNAGKDAKTKTPGWGYSSSPLVVNDVVVVASSGKLVAYDLATGNPRWFSPNAGGGYSSPHLLNIDGVSQILFMNGDGATGFDPADGKMLWQYKIAGVPIVQPAIVPDDNDLLITESEAGGKGLRRVAIENASGKWTTKDQWTSIGLKPYFNDFVVHNGYAYGFDGAYLSCIDLKDGERKWKGGKFGHGQLLLLADQDVMLILGEQGEIGLVSAKPDQFTELGRVPAISGKTWNHPALAGDTLLVRNGEEMAAFRLTLESQ